MKRAVARVVDAQNRLYERVRHRDAWTVTAATSGFEHLRGHKYAVLVTFRRSGEPVPTAVWFGLDGDRLYVRTERRSGKVKRLRSDSRVLVAPSDFRAKPLGPAAEGHARILERADAEHGERALATKYGLFRRVYEGVGEQLNADMVYLEVTPA